MLEHLFHLGINPALEPEEGGRLNFLEQNKPLCRKITVN